MEKLELENSKAGLVSIREKRMEGVLLRSRARWITEGEKVTSYFCSLEKMNYIHKRITKLDKNGIILSDENDIANEVRDFYSKLYSVREEVEITNIVDDLPTLNQEEQTSLDFFFRF